MYSAYSYLPIPHVAPVAIATTMHVVLRSQTAFSSLSYSLIKQEEKIAWLRETNMHGYIAALISLHTHAAIAIYIDAPRALGENIAAFSFI